MSKYFSTSKRGELQELKQDLASTDFNRKKEAIKKVIAQMTVGKDVSSLFQGVIRCLEYPQADIKKLVYLYIINYSRKKQEDAIMVIQPLRKDVAQGTPLIKALALRTMGCLRVEALNEYLQGPVKEGIEDRDAYVRKTAVLCVPKVYELNPKQIEEAGLITKMQKMLKRESNPVVIANVMIALYEISQMSEQSVLNIEPMVLQRLLNCINECIEWGQVFILDCLANYIPKDLEETEKIIERIYPRLQHINSSVVFSAVKVLVKYLDYVTSPELIRTATKKIAQPLVSLINHEFPEIQYVILRNIHYLIQKRPAIFDNMIKVFFCKFNEPYYIKNEKIEILVKLCSLKNCEMVLNELKECTKDVDIDFAIKSIKAVGIISLNFEKFVDKSIEILMDLVKDTPNSQPPSMDTVQEVMIAMVNIYRKYPSKIYCENSLKTLAKYFNLASEAQGKAAAVWILGEYGEKIENCVEMISEFIESFIDDCREVQLAILTATVKIFLKFPAAAEGIISQLLKTATERVQTPDVRDRAFIYWRMLSSDPEKTKQAVLADKPVIILEIPSFDTNFLDIMISNLALVSSVAQKTPEQLFKKKTNQIVRIENQEQDSEGIVPIEESKGASVIPEGNLQFDLQQQHFEQPQQQQQQQQQQMPNIMDMDLLDLDEPKQSQQQQQYQQQQQPVKQQQQTSFDLFDLDLTGTPAQQPLQQQIKAPVMEDEEDLFAESPQSKETQYNLCLNFVDQGKGGISNLKIEGRFVKTKTEQFPSLEMVFCNKTAQKLESYVIQLKKNYFNIALEKNSEPGWQGVPVNSTVSVRIPGIEALQLATETERKQIEAQDQLKFPIAFKCNFELYFFEVPCSLFALFIQAPPITLDSFIESWNAISPKNMLQIEILELYQSNYQSLGILKQLLQEMNCSFVNSSTNSQNQTKAKFYAQVQSDQVFFEVTMPLLNGKGCSVHAKSLKNWMLNFFIQGIKEVLSK